MSLDELAGFLEQQTGVSIQKAIEKGYPAYAERIGVDALLTKLKQTALSKPIPRAPGQPGIKALATFLYHELLTDGQASVQEISPPRPQGVGHVSGFGKFRLRRAISAKAAAAPTGGPPLFEKHLLAQVRVAQPEEFKAFVKAFLLKVAQPTYSHSIFFNARTRVSWQMCPEATQLARQIGLSNIADHVSAALALALKGSENDACVCARKRKVILLSEVIPSDHNEAFQVDAGCQTDSDILTRQQFEVIMADLQERFLATLGQLQLKIGEYEDMIQVMKQQLLPQHGSSNANKSELQTNEQTGHCVDGDDDMASKGLVPVKPDDIETHRERDKIKILKEQQREAKRVARQQRRGERLERLSRHSSDE
ncbi:unnamed protein product [Symbiodinium microadriaticum]|nr:unnamed protein product [Symbiodinium microadriaticum]